MKGHQAHNWHLRKRVQSLRDISTVQEHVRLAHSARGPAQARVRPHSPVLPLLISHTPLFLSPPSPETIRQEVYLSSSHHRGQRPPFSSLLIHGWPFLIHSGRMNYCRLGARVGKVPSARLRPGTTQGMPDLPATPTPRLPKQSKSQPLPVLHICA
jgi:hypothetical protein